MLLDTGADYTFLRPAVAHALGLELREEPMKIRGASAGEAEFFSASPSRVMVRIDHPDTAGRHGRPRLVDPVMVPTSDSVLPYSVLGREPFLEDFELTVRQAKREFVLREI